MARSVPGPVIGLPCIRRSPESGLIKPEQHVEERALAAARGPDDRQELALADVDVEVLQRPHRAAVRRPEGEIDVAALEIYACMRATTEPSIIYPTKAVFHLLLSDIRASIMACAAARVGRHNLRNLNHDEGFDRSGHGRDDGRGDPAGSGPGRRQRWCSGSRCDRRTCGRRSCSAPRRRSRATTRRRRSMSLRRLRPATGPAASRSGMAIAAPGCGRASRSATKSRPIKLSERIAAPARLARALLLGLLRAPAFPL